MSIDVMCKSIEGKMESAQRRKEQNLNQIKMRIKLENHRKERIFQQKVEEMQSMVILDNGGTEN